MKRAKRTAIISQMLSNSPNKIFSLASICQQFNISKATASEDISVIREAFFSASIGTIDTKKGPGGGFFFTPYIHEETALDTLENICTTLKDPNRILGGGFMYTSDLMFDPSSMHKLAKIFISKFKDMEPDYIVTVETKGIPLALMTSQLLNIPTVIVRREHKISEGPTLSINYFSSAAGKMKKMSISKYSIKPGSKAIIIDDFMRAGGSIKGIYELLRELDVEILTAGVAIASKTPEEKKISHYIPLMLLDEIDETTNEIKIHPNYDIFS